jgi:hypothetical protein
MNEHSVQVVISEPGGRQVRVSWQAPAGSSAPPSPLVLEVASVSAPTAPRLETFPPPMPSSERAARLETFPPPMWPYASSASGSQRLETFPPPMPSSAPPALSIELRWSEPPPPAAVLPAPPSEPAVRSEPAPLAVAWAAEKLRQRHLASAGETVRPRARTATR